MNTREKTGGPAFPPHPAVSHLNQVMTLRDYFAAKAMQAMLGSARLNTLDEDSISSDAYAVADAMLKERAK